MLLQDYIWIADENIHPKIYQFISAFTTVFSLKELNLLGYTDTQILNRANELNAIILTHDADFGKLAFLERYPIIGIIYLRPGHLSPDFHHQTLIKILEQSIEVFPPFIVVGMHNNQHINVRVRNKIWD